MPQQYRFRVKVKSADLGDKDGNGAPIRHARGTEITTDKELDKMFGPLAFERLDGPPQHMRERSLLNVKGAQPDDTMDPELHPQDPKGMAPAKKKPDRPTPPRAKGPNRLAQEAEGDEEEEGTEEQEDVDFGEDMTEVFDGAEEKGLQVFKKGKKYTVVSTDDPTKPLHGDDITRKTEVEALIAEHGAREESEESDEA